MNAEQETKILLQAAEKSGPPYIESVSLQQIAVNLARIADALKEKKE